ncbi:MAG: DNA translocase FtsK [Candidatus Calescibacterium sp.]|nr:DNA translocase FtsK [Candidatus Calescibacterium sp.]MCX7734061.1 DNA translocase FtsK [bacterium]MDW8087056.1 DNA translocase FtsK [Candidatus Calescibacterium sp.]
MIQVIISIVNIIISLAILGLSLDSSAPRSPFISGYPNEILMKLYGSVFLALGYGLIPLSAGFLMISLISLIKKEVQTRYIALTVMIAIGISAVSSYVSVDSGGILGFEIKKLFERLNLPQNLSLAIITGATFIFSFIITSPIILKTAKILSRKKTIESVDQNQAPEEDQLKTEYKRTEITLKIDETSHITDVINIMQNNRVELAEQEEMTRVQENNETDKDEEEYNEYTKGNQYTKDKTEKEKFELPSPDILDEPGESNYDPPEILSKTSRELLQALESFGIKGKITSVTSGPVVNFFEFIPETGIRATKIVLLGDDIAIAMRMPGIRIIAPVPGSGAVGFEVPRKTRSIVRLKEVFFAQEAKKMKIPLTIGKDIYGKPFVVDLQKLPHLLIAGTTGSGKSVLLNAIIISLLLRFRPDELKFILVDPKMLEFSPYSGIPNLVTDVVTSPKGAIDVLRWAVDEMLRRYQTMKKESAKNIDHFVEKTGQTMHRIIVVIDEFADLMVSSARKVEEYVMRLSQMARAAGIHLILTTQRPSADVVTGIIKSNLPARIALRVSDKTNSRVILDVNGAETLLGQGDFLFSMPGTTPQRGHACFISDNEISRVVEHLKKQGEPDYIQIITEDEDQAFMSPEFFENKDPKFREAIEIAKNFGQISISLLQRKLGIGFNRAARIVEEMEQEGIVKKHDKKLIYVGIQPKQNENQET